MNDKQISATIHSVEGKVDLIKRDIESINAHINQFKLHFDELFQKPNIPAEFQEFKRYVDGFIEETKEKNASTITSTTGIRSTLETVKNIVNHLDSEVRQLRQSILITDQKINDSKVEFLNKTESISSAFYDKFYTNYERQKKELEIYGNQTLSMPKSILETNKSILDKIDIALLETSNALSKMNNLEQSLKLMDRKFEALTIQVKKIELAKQA